MLRSSAILFSLVLLASVCFGQTQKVRDAVQAYQDGDLAKAKQLIDEASEDPESSGDGTTWYYRGFIYKDVYNRQEKANAQSPARLEAIRSYKMYLELDETKELEASNNKGLTYLASTLYNDAATSLNPQNYQVAIENYDRYKETMRVVDPSANFKARDIQFYLVLGSVYNQIYDSDRDNQKEFFNETKSAFEQVLSLDENNLSAHYNVGILYYNEAVNIIKNLPYDTDIITLELIQDECVELFRQSLPYMQRAYELDPKRKETVLGLAGIYFSLNEMEKSQQLQEELELLKETE